MEERFFRDLKTNEIKKYVIFLDIDGTIVCENSSFVDEATINKIEELRQDNKIYLLSNKKNLSRNQDIAKCLKIPYLNTLYKKPNKKILDLVENKENWEFLVIGDRFLIDGLFARKIGSNFIKVKKMISPQNNWLVKISYLIDNIIHYLFR